MRFSDLIGKDRLKKFDTLDNNVLLERTKENVIRDVFEVLGIESENGENGDGSA